MEKYSIKDLTSISNTTERAVRNLFKSNKELKELAAEHTITEKRNVFYDSAVYEWFCERYKKSSSEKTEPLNENKVVEGILNDEKQNLLEYTAPLYVRQENEAEKELKELQIKFDELKTRFEKVENERQELLKQNGNLLLLLSQERALTQKYLPAPRKTIGERLKALFHKENAENS